MFLKSEAMWAVRCPGYVNSSEYVVARELSLLTLPSVQTAGRTAWPTGQIQQPGVNKTRLQAQQVEQRFQEEQGRSVSVDISPLTAHMGATPTTGGVSGPYPWRQPV